ncbi:MAG: hypothetical protein OEM39_01915, partial [Acidimicrobiia bacterium]|nr:hypothetical protein [Acidimicrobiia bacterium]
PGDYTQLTGRAGRRGIDVEGYGVVLHSPYVRFGNVTDIAAVGSHPLKSSFRPTYNMTANLVSNYQQPQAEELLASSFAAYQREGDRHAAARTISALESQYEEELARATCERGSVEEYLALVESAQPRTRADGMASSLAEGAVVDVAGGNRDGRYVVIKRLTRKDEGTRYLVLSTSGRVSTLGNKEILSGSSRAGSLELPHPVRPRDRRFVQELLRRLRKLPPREGTKKRADPEFTHPVASCPDAARHLGAARRAKKLERRLEQYRNARRSSGYGLVEEFHTIVGLLTDLDYLQGWALTPRGERLKGVYNEMDLLIAESIEQGVFYALEPSELAALLSSFVYEPRSDQASPADWPTDELTERWARLDGLWENLVTRERKAKLSPTRRPDPGFALPSLQWASGVEFDEVITGGMAPGDFVRVSRQLVDLLKQIRDIAPELAEEAQSALKSIDRGVVAAQGVG